jgi:hypothetical protein
MNLFFLLFLIFFQLNPDAVVFKKTYNKTHDRDIIDFFDCYFIYTINMILSIKINFALNNDLVYSKNISQVIDFTTNEILTSIDNNIRFGFPIWIRKIVNVSFVLKDPDNPISKIEFRQLKAKLAKVKDDLINETNNTGKEYE